MKSERLMTLAVAAALGVASALPAQQRDGGRERGRDRDSLQSSASSSESTQPAAQGYRERYAVLEQRNPFMRDRSRPTTRSSSASTTQPTRRTLEESLVIRGIAMEELGYRAYFEDLNNNTTLRVSPGDALGRGRVVAIALDAIQYENDGKTMWIDIGSDLTGKASTASAAFASTSSSTTSPTTLPANIDLNDPSLSVEQRMRLRAQMLRQPQGQ